MTISRNNAAKGSDQVFMRRTELQDLIACNSFAQDLAFAARTLANAPGDHEKDKRAMRAVIESLRCELECQAGRLDDLLTSGVAA